jgi:hypothetical protein
MDGNDIQALQQRLTHFAEKLEGMDVEYGHARQIREYDSDRRKACLARYTLVHLNLGDSSAAAETKARTEKGYMKEMAEMGKQLESAEAIIAKWQAINCQFEASRSLLSCGREMLKI